MQTGRRRDLYMQGGTLVVAPSYNKSSTVRAIARFPDSVTSALLVAYLTILERVTAFVWEQLYPHDNGATGWGARPSKEFPRHCLFTLDGKPTDGHAVRAAFERKMRE